MAFSQVVIDTIPITSCRMAQVETILDEAIRGETGPLQLTTVNLDFLRMARTDHELRDILCASQHNFADGWPLLQMAKMLGHPLPERVTGSDLTPLIFRWAARNGWKVALVGSGEETRQELACQIPDQYGDVLAGHWIPDYRSRPIRDPELCQEIKATGAHIVLVALGCPKQERWLKANLSESGVCAGMGVGGSLDFMAGVQQRAPKLFQKMRMEWLYRAASQPRRLALRYAKDLLYYQQLLIRTAASATSRRFMVL